MLTKYVTALIASAGLVSSAAVAHADAIYDTASVFQPTIGSNEAVIVRSATNNNIFNSSGSDIVVIASPTRSLPVPAGVSQTVVISGVNLINVIGTCTVRSVNPIGTTTATVTQSQSQGFWSLPFTFTAAQAPAGNAFLVSCTLAANNGNRLIGLNVSP